MTDSCSKSRSLSRSNHRKICFKTPKKAKSKYEWTMVTEVTKCTWPAYKARWACRLHDHSEYHLSLLCATYLLEQQQELSRTLHVDVCHRLRFEPAPPPTMSNIESNTCTTKWPWIQCHPSCLCNQDIFHKLITNQHNLRPSWIPMKGVRASGGVWPITVDPGFALPDRYDDEFDIGVAHNCFWLSEFL